MMQKYLHKFLITMHIIGILHYENIYFSGQALVNCYINKINKKQIHNISRRDLHIFKILIKAIF